MAKFLDLTGLGQFKTKLQTFFEGIFLKKTEYTAPTIQIVKVNGSPLSPDGSKAVNIDLSTYAKKTEIPTKVSQLENDSGFLTEVPEEYVTDTELTAKGYQTSAQVQSAISTATQDMATNAGVDSKLESYAKTADLPTAITDEEIDGLFTE